MKSSCSTAVLLSVVFSLVSRTVYAQTAQPAALPKLLAVGGQRVGGEEIQSMGYGPIVKTLEYPKGILPHLPLTAINGTFTDQTTKLLANGDYEVSGTVKAADGGKITLRDSVNGLSASLFNTYAPAYNYPPGAVTIDYPQNGNVAIILPGAVLGPGHIQIPNSTAIVSYEVYDLQGDRVDTGPVTAGARQINFPKIKEPGWYNVSLLGKVDQPPFGKVIGATCFSLAPPPLPGINLPDLPTGGFDNLPAWNNSDGRLDGWKQSGPYRLSVPDAANPDLAGLTTMVAHAQAQYVSGKDGTRADPVRHRPLCINFVNLDCNHPAEVAGVTRVVAAMYPLGVAWYEGRNEPGGDPDASFLPQVQKLSAAIKAGNVGAKLMGPASVSTVGNGKLASLLAAGAGQYFDGYSFHAYNAANGDFDLLDKVMANYHAVLARYGQQDKAVWMTEMGDAAALAGVAQPARAAQSLAVRVIGFDRWNVPPERSYYWYTRYGTFEFANWLENPDGSWNPQALWLRRYAEETYAKPYASSYHFGSASVGYYGNRYDGQGPEVGKSVSLFMPKEGSREPLRLAVTGKRIPAFLVSRNAWGKATRLPIVAGAVTLSLSDGLNHFIPHSSALTLTPVGTDWGPDIALTASVTTPSNQSHAGLINNGIFENGYDTFEPTAKVFGTDGNWFADGGTVTGRTNGDTVFPCDITLDLASPKRIGHIALAAPLPFQGICAPVSLDVLTSLDNAAWTTRWSVRQAPRTQERFASQQTFGVYCWDYFAGQSTFIKAFSPFTARYVRFRYNQVSQGGQGDALAGSYGGQPGKPQVTIGEVMLFSK